MDIENNYGNQVRGTTIGSKTIVINRTPWVEQTIICGDDDEVVEPEREPELWRIIVASIVFIFFSPVFLLLYLILNLDKLLAVLVVVVGIFLAIYYKNLI